MSSSIADIYAFVEEAIGHPLHWITLDTSRMLMFTDDIGKLFKVDNNSTVTRQDVRNFLLYKNNIKTTRIWTSDVLSVSQDIYEYIEGLHKKCIHFDDVLYEWCVVLSLYGEYLVKNNLKIFLSNLASFRNLAQFYNLLWYCDKHIKLSNVKILKLLNLSNDDGELTELDDIMYNICQHGAKTEIPCEYDLYHLGHQLVALVKVKNLDEITEFKNNALQRILNYSPKIINTIVLIMANVSEHKQKSNYFINLVNISKELNPYVYPHQTYFDCSLKLTKRKKLTSEGNDDIDE